MSVIILYDMARTFGEILISCWQHISDCNLPSTFNSTKTLFLNETHFKLHILNLVMDLQCSVVNIEHRNTFERIYSYLNSMLLVSTNS